ncbi:MAG: hypothetical protein V2A56_01655 [bacterium]
MALNLTAAFLEARMSPSLLPFSASVATSSTFLKGAGGIGADGVPLPFSGTITGLSVWDGSTLRSDTRTLSVSANDRITLFATYSGGTFTVSVIRNGNFTNVQVSGVPANSTLQASVGLLFSRN